MLAIFVETNHEDMLLPRYLIYENKDTLDELLDNDMARGIFDILVNIENTIKLRNVDEYRDSEEQYVELFNTTYYLICEALHRPMPQLRINEYKEYIETQACCYNMNEAVYLDVIFSIMYYISGEIIRMDQSFRNSILGQISDPYFFNQLFSRSLEFRDKDEHLITWSLISSPKLTEDYLKDYYWKDENEIDFFFIRNVITYVSKDKATRILIAQSIMNCALLHYKNNMTTMNVADDIKKTLKKLYDNDVDLTPFVIERNRSKVVNVSDLELQISELKNKIKEQEECIVKQKIEIDKHSAECSNKSDEWVIDKEDIIKQAGVDATRKLIEQLIIYAEREQKSTAREIRIALTTKMANGYIAGDTLSEEWKQRLENLGREKPRNDEMTFNNPVGTVIGYAENVTLKH